MDNTNYRIIPPITLTFTIYPSGGAYGGNNSFTTVGTVYFPGTNVNAAPTALYAVIGGTLPGLGTQVRVITATGVIIGTSAAVDVSTTIPQIVQIPITGTFSPLYTTWDIQLLCTSGTAQIWSFHALA